ncbi:hypothetical protein, partial [Pantoea sp. aB]|uniref:hypothetical protein n=1 Tax=Pantoea sp. aB TaxID=517433 RepID=UPI0001E0C2AB
MQNKQLSDVKGKELVAAGHALANAIGMDTPLIEIAKMMAALATRLDCALVRGDELEAQRDAMAADNAALKELATGYADRADQLLSDLTGNCESDNRRECLEECNKTPATDAYLNSVRADAVQKLWEDSLSDVGQVLAEIRAYDDASEAAGIVHSEIQERVDDFVAQLR